MRDDIADLLLEDSRARGKGFAYLDGLVEGSPGRSFTDLLVVIFSS
jgi:hypothetical protein